jgi:hypothetical protein
MSDTIIPFDKLAAEMQGHDSLGGNFDVLVSYREDKLNDIFKKRTLELQNVYNYDYVAEFVSKFVVLLLVHVGLFALSQIRLSDIQALTDTLNRPCEWENRGGQSETLPRESQTQFRCGQCEAYFGCQSTIGVLSLPPTASVVLTCPLKTLKGEVTESGEIANASLSSNDSPVTIGTPCDSKNTAMAGVCLDFSAGIVEVEPSNLSSLASERIKMQFAESKLFWLAGVKETKEVAGVTDHHLRPEKILLSPRSYGSGIQVAGSYPMYVDKREGREDTSRQSNNVIHPKQSREKPNSARRYCKCRFLTRYYYG